MNSSEPVFAWRKKGKVFTPQEISGREWACLQHQPDRLVAGRREGRHRCLARGLERRMVSYLHVFELDGELWLAYLGARVGRSGFGLAVLDGDLT